MNRRSFLTLALIGPVAALYVGVKAKPIRFCGVTSLDDVDVEGTIRAGLPLWVEVEVDQVKSLKTGWMSCRVVPRYHTCADDSVCKLGHDMRLNFEKAEAHARFAMMLLNRGII